VTVLCAAKDYGLEVVCASIRHALEQGCPNPELILNHLYSQRDQPSAPDLDADGIPNSSSASAPADCSAYDSLLRAQETT
jgi:hypothetical protein